MKELPYNINQAARALGRSTSTISYWLENGSLVEEPSRGKARFITAESLRAKAAQIGVELREGDAA